MRHHAKLARNEHALALVPRDLEPGELVIVGWSGHFRIKCRGSFLPGLEYPSLAKAECAANAIEYRARLTTRKCLCCGTSFESAGPGNRMCDPCRDWAKSVG